MSAWGIEWKLKYLQIYFSLYLILVLMYINYSIDVLYKNSNIN